MKITLFLLVSFLLLIPELNGQSVKSDTIIKVVDISKFHLRKKIVRAEYGKVIFYFNQIDYLGVEAEKDTVRTTPKYFDDYAISRLLKIGHVNIFRRSDSSFVQKINHRLEETQTLGIRYFEFIDGIVFFSKVERRYSIGSFLYELHLKDSSVPPKTDSIVPVKEFAYEEEFPDLTNKGSIKINDYFPLINSRYYVYHDPSNGYGETDTNQCRMTKLEGQEIFYFAECYNKFGITSIDVTMFGSGFYLYRNDSLFVIDANYEEDIQEKEIKEANLLLPNYMKPGDTAVINSIWNKTVITYLFPEDIYVQDVNYRECIKLKILEYWPGTTYLSYVWLKKGVGMVKWMRPTGKIDELINSFSL